MRVSELATVVNNIIESHTTHNLVKVVASKIILRAITDKKYKDVKVGTYNGKVSSVRVLSYNISVESEEKFRASLEAAVTSHVSTVIVAQKFIKGAAGIDIFGTTLSVKVEDDGIYYGGHHYKSDEDIVLAILSMSNEHLSHSCDGRYCIDELSTEDFTVNKTLRGPVRITKREHVEVLDADKADTSVDDKVAEYVIKHFIECNLARYIGRKEHKINKYVEIDSARKILMS